MTGELFNPEAFEHIRGQLSMSDRTWDGEPLWSPESAAEAAGWVLTVCSCCLHDFYSKNDEPYCSQCMEVGS